MIATAEFFVAGGTVPPGSPSYVEREADRELFQALRAGEYCYVLNSRQMGKSSLAVRTIERLREAGLRTAFIDLTRIGGANVNPDQWYAGLLAEAGRVLGLRTQAVAFMREHREVGAVQRFLSFLQEVALPDSPSPLIVILDEIDAVRSLTFSTDELFAGIRQLHNGRASDPALARLTFCLLGAALPSDLIRDPRTTPFNVGRRVELRDFSEAEARPLAAALGGRGEEILDRVRFWTGGHPFLTQTICAELAAATDPTPALVDRIVRERYLDARARDTDTNLADVGNRLLGRGDPNVGDRQMADTLSLYAKLLKAGVPDDESNPAAARIKMSGVARLDHGRLTIRNRIYREVFGPAWVRENMPGQELRRQRRAFWKGVLRTGGVATAVVCAIGGLAWNNYRLMRQAQYETYVASMRTLPLALQQNDLEEIDATLDEQKDNPARGWEWNFWRRITHRSLFRLPLGMEYGNNWIAFNSDVTRAAVASRHDLVVLDLRHRRALHHIPVSEDSPSVVWLRDGRRLLAFNNSGWLALVDSDTGKIERQGLGPPLDVINPLSTTSPNDRVAYLQSPRAIVAVDLDTLKGRSVPLAAPGQLVQLTCDQAGKRLYTLELDEKQRTHFRVYDIATWRSFDIPIPGTGTRVAVSPNGSRGVVALQNGNVVLIDMADRKPSRPFPAAAMEANVVCLSDDGSRLFTTDGSREARVFDAGKDRLRLLETFRDATDGTIAPDGSQVYLRYFDLNAYRVGGEREVPQVVTPGALGSAISPDGVLYSLLPTQLRSCDLASGANRTQSVPPGTQPTAEQGFGRFVVVGPSGGGVLWNMSTGRSAFRFPPSFFQTPQMYAVSPDERKIAFETPTAVSVYDLRTGGRLWSLPIPAGISALRFSPDSSRLALGSLNGEVAVMRAADGKPVCPAGDAGFAIFSCDFSSDGERLATCGNDDEGSIWSLRDGKRLFRLRGHSQSVLQIVWSPDDRRVATGSADRTIRIWDPETGREIGIVGRHDSSVVGLRFLPGGRTLASVSDDGVAKLWMTEARR